MMQHFTRDNLPTTGWGRYRVRASAVLYRVDGPFLVEHFDGVTYCADGYLAYRPDMDYTYAIPQSDVTPDVASTTFVPVYLAIGDEPLDRVGEFVGQREPISNEVVTEFLEAAIRNTVDEAEPGPGTVEVPVYSRVGEHGEPIQIGTVTLQDPKQDGGQ